MKTHDKLARFAFTALAASGALVIASCGGLDTDYGLGQMYPVSGTVTYNGTPLEKGEIVFTPEDLDKGVGAGGSIENGSYALGTAGDKNGARTGKYKVTVTAMEDSQAKAREAFEKTLAKDPGLAKNVGKTRIPGQFLAKAAQEAKSLIPAGYGDLRTTTFTAEVKAESNTFDFKLTDAEAPPEPSKGSVKGKGRRK